MLCSFQSASALRRLPLTFVRAESLKVPSRPTATKLLYSNLNGGDEEDRTPDPLRARQVLSQLSYTPIFTTINIL